MAHTVDSISIRGFRKAHLRQLATYIRERARLADIDVPAPLLDAGRDSVVATVDGAHADHGEVRRCVALAVLYCESRRPPPFECGLREGVDYFVERAEE